MVRKHNLGYFLRCLKKKTIHTFSGNYELKLAIASSVMSFRKYVQCPPSAHTGHLILSKHLQNNMKLHSINLL